MTLLEGVVEMCIDLGYLCAQALASASGAEFRASFIGDTGASAQIGRPGHGRALALELHQIASTIANEIATCTVNDIHKQTGRLETKEGRARRNG